MRCSLPPTCHCPRWSSWAVLRLHPCWGGLCRGFWKAGLFHTLPQALKVHFITSGGPLRLSQGDALGVQMSRPGDGTRTMAPSARPQPVLISASIALMISTIVTLTISPSASHGSCSRDRPLAGNRTPASPRPRTAFLEEALDPLLPGPCPRQAPSPALRTLHFGNIHVPLRA